MIKNNKFIRYKYSWFKPWKLGLLLFLTILCACQSDKQNGQVDTFLKDHHSPKYKWGYINTNGDLSIEDKYDDARDFSESYAAVNFKGKWGYIDQKGQNKIGHEYKEASAFIDQKAVVKLYNDEWAIIDKKGEPILKISADRLFPPQDEFARFQSGSLYGYLSLDGDTLAEKSFGMAYDFVEGYALVSKMNQYALLNANGDQKQLKGEKVFPAKSERYRFKSKGKYGYYSSSGDKLFNTVYDYATDFHNNLAFVKNQGKAYILDTNGSLKIIPINNLEYHSPGHLIESSSQGQVLYDFKMNKLSNAFYDMYYTPTEGITAVMKNDLWGFIDESGDPITDIAYPLVWEYREGKGRYVEPKLGIGFMDRKGKVVIKPYFIEVKDFSEQLARVQVYN